MAKPDRTCFGRGVCLHIGPCCDFWADDGMCVCNPVDAAEYPRAQRLYIAGNISGFANPNIRTVFPDGHDHVRTFDRGDYCWAYWDWGSGTVGTVKFELRDGSAVRASRSTKIIRPSGVLNFSGIDIPPTIVMGDPCPISAVYNVDTDHFKGLPCARLRFLVDGVIVYNTRAYGTVCSHLPDGRRHSVDIGPYITSPGIHTVLLEMVLVSPKGVESPGCSYTTIIKVLPCDEGAKRSPKTCWDGSKIHEQVCKNGTWVPSGETCPPEPAAGEKRGPKTCWDGSVIHAEKYDAALHRWVPSGEACPPKPECTEGDKKAGYVCVGGKWQPAPAVPEPVVPPVSPVVPPVAPPEYLTPEEAADRIRAGLPCYIKCTLPILDMLPGIPYTPGMWVPPFCEITTEP